MFLLIDINTDCFVTKLSEQRLKLTNHKNIDYVDPFLDRINIRGSRINSISYAQNSNMKRNNSSLMSNQLISLKTGWKLSKHERRQTKCAKPLKIAINQKL